MPTRLHLAAASSTVAGFLLQRLPDESKNMSESNDVDGWDRIRQLGATLSDEELLQLDTPSIIQRLFHQENVRLFESLPMSFRCRCSQQRTESMLISLGEQEIDSILTEQGQVEVICQFCGMAYRFDAIDAQQLFAADLQPNIPTTRH